MSCWRVSPAIGQEIVEKEPSGGLLAVGTSGAFVSAYVLSLGYQPEHDELQQLESPEMASQLRAGLPYKCKGELWESTCRKTLSSHPCL